MSSTHQTYTNTMLNAFKASDEAFQKRLQHLYPCVDDVTKLPQAWSTELKSKALGLTHDNLTCYFSTTRDEETHAELIKADNPIPPSCLLYYFEIEIVSKGRDGLIGIGLESGLQSTQATKMPGLNRDSYGYHGADGHAFYNDTRGQPFGPKYTTGDIIGCGYNLVEGKCFFTKNGLNLGKAFDDIPSNVLLYPTIGLKTPGEEIRANFGQENFKYDIEQDLRSLKKNMALTISNYPISDFSNWQSTLHQLVQSWLLQNSYPSTADAFTRSTKLECKENLQRIQQRNRIQQLVLSGRISEAIRLTNRLCPSLLQNNPNLLFVLKCRQFVELISGAESDYQPIFNYANVDNTSNGLQRIISNGDRPGSPSHVTKNNGCNGLIDCIKGDKTDNQQSGSSSSLQDLMDIDQPIASTNANNESNHRRSSINTNSNNNHSTDQTPVAIKLDANGNDRVHSTEETEELEGNEQKIANLLHFGRELSDYLQQLDKIYGKNEINEKMFQDAIGLIAYTNPESSCFGKLLDPSGRQPISQLLNSSIVKAEMGDSYRPPLEDVMFHLRKLVRRNDSHGGWLMDRLY